MAGFYDRLHPNGLDGNGGDRVAVTYTIAAIKGVSIGLWDKIAARDAINNILASQGLASLRTEDETDLSNIIDQFTGTVQNQLVYGQKVEAVFRAAEFGQVTEAKWRTDLGIS